MWSANSSGATAAILLAKNIYLYVRDTVPLKLATVSDQAALSAIGPTVADAFGDGTGRPA
jgi:hypothetical protein